jgi:hypothetical protein
MNTWITWALVLLAQNFSFTFVSRARNSGSLKRHVVASTLSNGVWFASQCILFNQMIAWMQGQAGLKTQIFAGAFYTFFTIVGSIAAHYVALRTEKGKSAVGASSKYAQITKEEWESVKAVVNYHLVEKIA